MDDRSPAATHAADHEAEVARLEREVSLMLRRARSMSRMLAAHVQPDIDPASYAVLVAIARAAPLRMVDLADEMGLDKSTMSRQVSGLMRLGLVQRSPDPDDGRAFLLELSDDGRRGLQAVAHQRHEFWMRRLDSWSTDEIGALADGLSRLATAINATAPVGTVPPSGEQETPTT